MESSLNFGSVGRLRLMPWIGMNCLLVSGASGANEMSRSGADGLIDFATQVRPIFEEKCFRCHDEEKQKGELRLDTADWIRKGGELGAVIEPGDAEESPLYFLTTYPDDDPDFMPQKGDGLTEDEKALLRDWIDQGARFGDGVDWSESIVSEKTVDTEKVDSVLAKAEFRISGSDTEKVAKVAGKGILVDTMNNDANWFEVSLTYMDPFDLSALEPLREKIVKIDLSRSQVTDQDLEALGRFENLRSLNLRKTTIGDEGLASLVELRGLVYLNLHDTQVTDRGIASLSKLENLETLYLWGSAVSPQAAKQLSRKLPKATVNTGE